MTFWLDLSADGQPNGRERLQKRKYSKAHPVRRPSSRMASMGRRFKSLPVLRIRRPTEQEELSFVFFL
jgi:hypothetical protein